MKFAYGGITQVWIPTYQEIKKKIESFQKYPTGSSIHKHKKEFENCYWEVINERKNVSTPKTRCMHCNAKLIEKHGMYGVFYACPNWKTNNRGCVGEIVNRFEYSGQKKPTISGYLFDISKLFEKKTGIKTKAPKQVRKIMNTFNLPSLGKLIKIEAYENTKGIYPRISKRSNNQEATVWADMDLSLPELDIKQSTYFMYRFISGYTSFCQIDVHLVTKGVVIYVEVKNSLWDYNIKQVKKHKNVLECYYKKPIRSFLIYFEFDQYDEEFRKQHANDFSFFDGIFCYGKENGPSNFIRKIREFI